jgi:hypothetical protein
MRALLAPLVLLAAMAAPHAAQAQDIAWSGFATLGYAQSPDVPGRYLRWIDDNGTFNADSVAALQADWRINPRWSATVQLKAAPSEKSDDQWQLRPAWAFLAWRPDDAWLVRAGRMRLPLYMYSESLDVGVAQDMARLPMEMYSIIPSNEYNGVSIGHTRATSLLPDGELAVEAYGGRIGTTARFWLRDGAPPQVAAGERYVGGERHHLRPGDHAAQPRTTLRLGLHEARTARLGGERTPVDYPFVSHRPRPGLLQGQRCTARAPDRDRAAHPQPDHHAGCRAAAGRRLARGCRAGPQPAVHAPSLGSNTLGGYVTVFREIGAFTPYVSAGRLQHQQPADGPLPGASSAPSCRR